MIFLEWNIMFEKNRKIGLADHTWVGLIGSREGSAGTGARDPWERVQSEEA